jgi:hypothetical protein
MTTHKKTQCSLTNPTVNPKNPEPTTSGKPTQDTTTLYINLLLLHGLQQCTLHHSCCTAYNSALNTTQLTRDATRALKAIC